MEITKENFSDLVKKIMTRETSADPENWTDSNPLWGHCAVVSLLAQDYFGGELMRASLEHIPEYSYLKSHYWNKFSDNIEKDFTAEQFINKPENLKGEVRDRERVLSYPDTQRRYSLLVSRFKDLAK